MTPEQAERKAKAERAKKLLAKRKKEKEGLVSSKASSEIGSASPRASIDVPSRPTAVESTEELPSKSTKGEEPLQNGSGLKESTAEDEAAEKGREEVVPVPFSSSVEESPAKGSQDESAQKKEVVSATIKGAQGPAEEKHAAVTDQEGQEKEKNDQPEPIAETDTSTTTAVSRSADQVADSVKPSNSTVDDSAPGTEAEIASATNNEDKKSKKKKKKGKTGGQAEKVTPDAEPEEEDEPAAVDEGIVEQMMVDEVESLKGDEQEHTAAQDQSMPQPKLEVAVATEHESVPLPKQLSTQAPETSPAPTNTEESTFLAAAQDEITSLKTQLDVLSHFRTAATQLEEETTTLRSTLDNYRERIDRMNTLEAECDERRTEVEALHEQMADVEHREEQARDEARRIGREREDAEERAREAEERLERQRERESGLEVEVNRLKRERVEWQAGKEESEASLAGVREEHAGALERLQGLQTTHDSLRADQATLQASLKKITEELESTRDRLTSATTALAASDARAEEFSASVTSLTDARDALQLQLGKESKRCEQAVAQRGALLQDNQGLLAQLEEMRERNGELMKNLVTVTEERDALQASVGRLELEVGELKQAKKIDDAETERFRREYEDETRLRKDTERDLETTREMLEQRNKTHSEQLAELQPRLEALTVAHSEIERELDVAGATKDGDDEAGASATAAVVGEIQNLKAEIKRVRAEMDDMKRSPTATDTQQEDPVALVQAQHALEISNYSSKLRSIESALHAESSRSHSLSKQIMDLQAELFDAKRQQQQREQHPSASLSYRLAPTTTMIDEKLPPAVRQKRRTALALLKARLSAASTSAPGTPSTEADHRPDHSFRSQLSEDAVFWCPCCDGDLISL